jgi:hypothetical protein
MALYSLDKLSTHIEYHSADLYDTYSLSVLCLLITRERDKKYENLIYWGKTQLGFSTLPHIPWLQEGTEMSCDWEGGLKRVWRVENKM